jgi:hypothetical protein
MGDRARENTAASFSYQRAIVRVQLGRWLCQLVHVHAVHATQPSQYSSVEPNKTDRLVFYSTYSILSRAKAPRAHIRYNADGIFTMVLFGLILPDFALRAKSGRMNH